LREIQQKSEVVLRLKAIALTAALIGGFTSGASAITVTKVPSMARSALTQIDYKMRKSYNHKGRQKYRAGGHYDRAPSNWHRYGKRPGDWQRRGCVIVGPIWWCP
jgi:hypothetical protein